MLKRLNKGKGNRYTLFSIILIIMMLYAFKLATGGNEATYPERVYYNNYEYVYKATVRESSTRFIRDYGMNYEGYVLLLKRSDKGVDVPERVYIFAKWRKYREYQLVK